MVCGWYNSCKDIKSPLIREVPGEIIKRAVTDLRRNGRGNSRLFAKTSTGAGRLFVIVDQVTVEPEGEGQGG